VNIKAQVNRQVVYNSVTGSMVYSVRLKFAGCKIGLSGTVKF